VAPKLSEKPPAIAPYGQGQEEAVARGGDHIRETEPGYGAADGPEARRHVQPERLSKTWGDRVRARDERADRPALDLLERYATGELRLHVPDLFLYEMGSLFLVAVRRGRLTEKVALQHIEELERLHLETISLRGEMDSALSFSRRLGVSFYDAAYLAAAESRGAPIVTCDQRLIQAASGYVDWVLTPAEAAGL